MSIDRVSLLEQQFTVMNQEITEVLTQVQTSMQGFAKSTSMALTVLMQRIEELERRAGMLPPGAPPVPAPSEGGKEL